MSNDVEQLRAKLAAAEAKAAAGKPDKGSTVDTEPFKPRKFTAKEVIAMTEKYAAEREAEHVKREKIRKRGERW